MGKVKRGGDNNSNTQDQYIKLNDGTIVDVKALFNDDGTIVESKEEEFEKLNKQTDFMKLEDLEKIRRVIGSIDGKYYFSNDKGLLTPQSNNTALKRLNDYIVPLIRRKEAKAEEKAKAEENKSVGFQPDNSCDPKIDPYCHGVYGGKSRKLRRKVKRGGDNNSNAKCAGLKEKYDKLLDNHIETNYGGPDMEMWKSKALSDIEQAKRDYEKCAGIEPEPEKERDISWYGGKARRTRRTNKVKKSGKKARKSSKKSRKAGKKARKTHRRRR